MFSLVPCCCWTKKLLLCFNISCLIHFTDCCMLVVSVRIISEVCQWMTRFNVDPSRVLDIEFVCLAFVCVSM
jgi:hypothetical protein